MITEKKAAMLQGILFIALFACTAFYLGEMPWAKAISFSSMIIGIILGMIYANTLRKHLPETWNPGIQYCSKRILKIGIIFYGFRLTLQDITAVGLSAIVIDAIIVAGTICLGMLIGKLLKIDKDTTMLTSCGSAICGAAAVLGTESVIRTQPYKTAVAVSTVVIFGTLSMFIYPILYRAGIFNLPTDQMGIFTGSTVHEVAHVVGAGNAMGEQIASTAIIVKMIRVMMLVVVLLVLAFATAKKTKDEKVGKSSITIPWFAIMFLVVILFNSFIHLPEPVINFINTADTFLLTMAMTALGVETSFDKFKKAGAKPFLLAGLLYIWLICGGYCLAKYLVPLMS